MVMGDGMMVARERRTSKEDCCLLSLSPFFFFALYPPPPPLTHPTTGKDAGACFERASEMQVKLDARHEAAAACVEAAKCYQKTDKADVVRALHSAVALYSEIGRLAMAARSLRDVGEALEKGGGSSEAAVEFYGQAADLFSGEEQHAEASKCRLRVAALSAEAGRYGEAAEIFEDIARAAVDSPLLKYGAKGHLLNAGICRLCAPDAGATAAALSRYEATDPTFAGSREGDLLRALAAAQETRDVEGFTAALGEFDSMTRLDAWKTGLLLRAKKGMEGIGTEIGGGGGGGGGGAGEEDLT